MSGPLEGLAYPDIYNDVSNRAELQPRKLNSNPLLNRAINQLEGVYPVDMLGIDVLDMPWDDPRAGSTVAGSTNIKNRNIQMNPFISTAFPQGLTESTLAHELQHVRQLRRQTPIDRLKELVIPYNERPMEKEADQAAEQYDILMGGKKGWTKTWNADPTIFEQLPKMLKKGK